MNTLRIPALADIEFSPAVLELNDLRHTDTRLQLVALWSFAALHGAGPHHPLAIAKACDSTDAFVDALGRCGWVEFAGDAVMIRRWEDVLAYVEPAPAVTETKEERNRRLQRERTRRFRAKHRQLDV